MIEEIKDSNNERESYSKKISEKSKVKIPKSRILFQNLQGKPIKISRQRTLSRPHKKINK